ncbi:cytochrome b5 protein [Rutstroemia sp. NJR-2017a WRK4]|nr:cytochrome b5 protein [Rutstroemia sp. NJR-2017a WRK4]
MPSKSKPYSKSSSSNFTLSKSGYANLTAVALTSSLYLYLFAQNQKNEREQVEEENRRLRELQERLQVQQLQLQEQQIKGEEEIRGEQRINQGELQQSRLGQAQAQARLRRNYKMSKTFSPSEVANHKDAENGMYIIIDENVYDVTGFVDEHPGGAKILKRVAGKDASKQFWKYHNDGVLKKYSERLKVGTVGEKAKL